MSANQPKRAARATSRRGSETKSAAPTQTTAASSAQAAAVQHDFPVDRTHLISAAVMFCILFVAVSTAPPNFWLLLILPLIFTWYVLRSGTTIDESGIRVRHAWKAQRTIPWEQFDGLKFRKAKTLAVDSQGNEVVLPGITFAQLPAVAAASRGRIPDAITQAQEAENGNMVLYSQDGYSRMLTKDEYDAEHDRLKAEVKEKLARRDAVAAEGDIAGDTASDASEHR